MKDWDRYFRENRGEAKRIFGAVASFRFVLVAGTAEEWRTEHGQKWRIYHQNTSHIEIRSMDTFFKSLEAYKSRPNDLWNFAEYPKTWSHGQLESYWQNYSYMDRWRQIID